MMKTYLRCLWLTLTKILIRWLENRDFDPLTVFEVTFCVLLCQMAAPHGGNPSIVGKIFCYSIDFLQELGRGSFGTVYRGYDDDGNVLPSKKSAKMTKRKPAQGPSSFISWRTKYSTIKSWRFMRLRRGWIQCG